MEGERGVLGYELQVSALSSTPVQAIHELGFVHQFAENQQHVMSSFLAPAPAAHQISQPLNSTAMGFSHNDQVSS